MYWVALAAMLQVGGWKSAKHLTDAEFDHYYALRVFMDESQTKKYLKMKTEEERDAYLKELGLWDKFYKYDDHIRQKIVDGDVQIGWTIDMVYMAWGAPYDRRKLAGRKAERSELLVYRFEQQPDGRVLVWTEGSKTEYKATRLFIREVTVDDDVVVAMEDKDAHW
jgi:hypothetical protein